MAQAAKIIGGAALIAGAVALDVATGGAAFAAGAEEFTAFLSIIGATGASLIASGTAGLLATPPPGQGVTSQNPIKAWDIIYGQVKTGGTFVDIESNGGILSNGSNTYDKCTNFVVMLAAHPIKSIDQVRLAGKAIPLGPGGSGAESTTWSYSPPSNQNQTSITSISRSGGVVTLKLSAGLAGQNGLQFNVRSVRDNTFNGVFTVTQPNPTDDTTFTYLCGGADGSSSGGYVLTTYADYKNRCHFDLTTCLGNHTSTFPEFLATSNLWTPAHKNLGKASLYAAFYYDATVFASGLPQMSFVCSGKADIYDPRLGDVTNPAAHIYTTNAALIIADYLTNKTWGYGLSYGTDVPLAQLIAAANICDETVVLAAGGSEARYTINMTFDLSRSRGEVLQDMLAACAGRITIQSGQYVIVPGAWVGPSLSLTQDNLIGPIDYKPIMTISGVCNGVKGTYTSPVTNWQSADIPPYAEDELHGYTAGDRWLAADGGVRLWKDVGFPATTSVATAQRLAKIELERTRREGRLTLHCDMSAYPAVALDVIDFTYPRYGWNNKTFEVLSSTLAIQTDPNGGAPRLGVDLELAETDSTVYDWNDAGDELTAADTPSPAIANGNILTGPQFLELESGPSTTVTGADGICIPRILAAWLTAPDATIQSGGYVQVEYQKVGDPLWIPVGTVSGTQTQCYISGVVSGSEYNVQIQGFTAKGIGSGWAQAGPITVSATQTFMSASSLTYPDGTPVADLQPATAGADVTSVNIPTEMLTNGSFEQGLTGWTSGSGTVLIDTTVSKYGKQSLSSHGGGFDQSTNVSLLAGHTYTAQAWVKTNGSVVGNGSSGATIGFSDPSKYVTVQKTNGTPVNAGGTNPAVALAATTATDWTQIQFTFSVSTNCSLAFGGGDCYGTITTLNATAWFDGVSMEDITGGADVTTAQPIVYAGIGANLIANGSFLPNLGIQGWVAVVGAINLPYYFLNTGLGIPPTSGAVSPTFAVIPGQTYRCQFTGAANSTGGTNAVFHRILYSPTYTANTQGTPYVDFLSDGSIPNTLETYTYTWTCPAGVYFASLAVYQLGTTYLYYSSIMAQDYGAVSEWGADVTLTNTAAGIVGQGALATLSQVTTSQIATSAVNTVNITANAVNTQILYSNTSQITAVASSTTVLATSTLSTNGGYCKIRCMMEVVGLASGSGTGHWPYATVNIWKGVSGSTSLAFYGNLFIPPSLLDGGLSVIAIEAMDEHPDLAQQYTVTMTCGTYPVNCDSITLVIENAKV